MTADIELLPLYAELQGHPKIEIIKHYACANVAHATAAKDAEIEALRAEVRQEQDYAAGAARRVLMAQIAQRRAEARAERLAEALRLAEEHINDLTPEWYSAGQKVLAEIRAALHDHDQEMSNG